MCATPLSACLPADRLLCFLATPIDFRAIDGKPVNTLFMLISPTVQTHLHLLCDWGSSSETGAQSTLKQQAAPDELMTTITAAESQIKR